VIIGIHHVQITVPSGAEQEARRFYCELLGLPEIPKPENLIANGGLWLQVGGQQVHIGIEEDFDRRATKAHVAYEVSDLAMWRAKLIAAGVDVLGGREIPGHARFEFRDPFGNRVEVIQRTNSRSSR
jgi:catechol 2,3-dioxygenase-like lactoylglutathione lyase family enzyme